ncbi:TolB family protein [Actinotalea fermentans]|nr:PD40 domain-containing protein [Actinotalea fermentans]KGM14814.1 hypothetical protein N867_15525 [Actinotalea fermentans ATCC 43279 = JCM 9966 = DSM 3133]
MAPHGTVTPDKGSAQDDISFSSYTADVTGDLEDISRLTPATGAVTRVSQQASPEALSHRGGQWSPDRTRLVGWGTPSGSASGNATRIYDAVSGDVAVELGWGEMEPTWFDDHTLLVLQRCSARLPGQQRRDVVEVVAVDVAAWTVRQVTQLGHDQVVGAVRWHPRSGLALDVGPDAPQPWMGRRVAVVPAARVRRAVAGTAAPVSRSELRYPFGDTPLASPDWSPDGARLVMVRMPGEDSGWVATDIVVGSVRSGRVSVLVDGSGLHDGDPAQPSGYGMPAWSPDGASIAWVEYFRDAWAEIWVMDASGARKHQVTSFGHTEVVVSLDW